MADGSDDAEQIDDLCKLVERGVVVAAASRYMSGGQQIGGPLLKRRCRGSPGCRSTGSPASGTRDATNSFKAYSTEFVREVGIESDAGFEIGIELVAKARRLRRPVAEIPTIWLERAHGHVELQGRAVDPALPAVVPLRVRAAAAHVDQVRRTHGGDARDDRAEGAGHRLVRLHRRLRRRGAPRAAATRVVGIDNHSKYGKVAKSYDDHPQYTLVEGDARDVDADDRHCLMDCDHFIAGAALIGGISYFHTFAYDLLATNERIIAASCDAAIAAHRRRAARRRSRT